MFIMSFINYQDKITSRFSGAPTAAIEEQKTQEVEIKSSGQAAAIDTKKNEEGPAQVAAAIESE